MKKTNKGFTLVELIIVIAVIGVLAAILIPTFANVIDKANRKSAFSDAKNALQLYLSEKTTGENGGDCVEDGTIFKVEKAGKNWYFQYTDSGLKEMANINDDANVNGKTAHSDTTFSGFPTTVTMYLP